MHFYACKFQMFDLKLEGLAKRKENVFNIEKYRATKNNKTYIQTEMVYWKCWWWPWNTMKSYTHYMWNKIYCWYYIIYLSGITFYFKIWKDIFV